MGECSETIEINGTTYCRQRDHETGKKNRHVVVIDRGWIIAGDLIEGEGRIRLQRPCILRSFSGVGFEGAVADPKSDKVTIRALPAPVDLPSDAELFRIPVGDLWGI